MKQIAEHSESNTSPEIVESEITVRFSLDMRGDFETKIRCGLTVEEIQETIRKAENSFLLAVAGPIAADDQDSAKLLTFELRCWILDGDLFSEEITIGLVETIDDRPSLTPTDLRGLCEAQVNKVRPRFWQALQDRHIAFD